MQEGLSTTINEFLSKCNQLTTNKNREIEIRFGRVKGTEYIPGLGLYQWQNVKDWAVKRSRPGKDEKPVYMKVEDTVTSVPDRGATIRFIDVKAVSFGPNKRSQDIFKNYIPISSYERKQIVPLTSKEPTIVSINFGLRLALNIENPASAEDMRNLPSKLVRTRERYSFLFGGTVNQKQRLDLTTVKENGKIRYECELEIADPNDSKISDFVTKILAAVQGSSIVYTYKLRDELLIKINKILLGSETRESELSLDYLVQPRNLKWADIKWGGLVGASKYANPKALPLARTEYVMMHKADGLRRLMLIDTSGIWLIYPKFIVSCILPRPILGTTGGQDQLASFLDKFSGTLIDGEFIPPENQKVENKFVTMYVAIDLISLPTSKEGGSSQTGGIRNKEVYWTQSYDERMKQLLIFQEELDKTIKAYAPGEPISLSFICPPVLSTIRGESFNVERDGTGPPSGRGRVSNNWPPATDFFEGIIDLYQMLEDPFSVIKYATDGFIFYPVSIPYLPFHPGLFLRERVLSYAPDVIKWKPPNQLTIDLGIEDQKDGTRIVLVRNKYVDFHDDPSHVFDVRYFDKTNFTGDGFYEVQKRENELAINGPRLNAKRATDIVSAAKAWRKNSPFIVHIVTSRIPTPYSIKRQPYIKESLRILVHGGVLVPFEGTFAIPFNGDIDWDNEKYKKEYKEPKNGEIVEFAVSGNSLIPIKPRPEKPYPNEFEIAEEIWTLAHDPITRQTLEGFDFRLQNKYHLFLKQRLLSRIESGRIVIVGGKDLPDLRIKDFSEVIVIEKDSSIVKNIKTIPKVRVLGNISDLNNLKIKNFDAVVFFDTIDKYNPEELSNILRIVDSVLKENGYLSIFTLDGDSIEETMKPAFRNKLYLRGEGKEDENKNTYTANFNGIKIVLQNRKITINTPALENVPETVESRYLFSFYSLLKGLFGYKNISFEKAGGELLLPSYQYQFSRLYSSIVMQKSRSGYAAKIQSSAGKAIGLSGKKKNPKTPKGESEGDEGAEVEISEDEDIIVLETTPIGSVRLLMSSPFFDLLLNAFSSTYSSLSTEEDKTLFREQYRSQLAEYLRKNRDEELFEDYEDEEIERMVNALTNLWPFRPIGYKGKNVINTVKDYNMLSKLVNLNILIFKYTDDTLEPLIVTPQIKENKTVVFAQDDDRFYLVGELDQRNSLYRTVFSLQDPISPTEVKLAKLKKPRS